MMKKNESNRRIELLIIILIFTIILVLLIMTRNGIRSLLDQELNGSYAIPSATQEIPVFATQTECQQKTGKACYSDSCDNIPKGKTLEEICGKDFKKGWKPQIIQP